MLNFISNTFSVIGYTVIIIFVSVIAAVLLIGPYGDNSKENVLITAYFVLALVGGLAVNNIIRKYLKQ